MQHVTCEETMKRESSATCLKRIDYHQVRLSWLYQPAKNREFHFFGIFPQSARFSSLYHWVFTTPRSATCPDRLPFNFRQLWQFVGSFLRKAAVKKILGIEELHWNHTNKIWRNGGSTVRRFKQKSKSDLLVLSFWFSTYLKISSKHSGFHMKHHGLFRTSQIYR